QSQRRRTWLGYGVVIAAAATAVAVMSIATRVRPDPAPIAIAPTGAPLGAGVIELPSRARVLVRAGAAVSLVRDDAAGTVLRVTRGTLLANVAKRAPGRPFVVLAGDVTVEVVGTMFTVDVADDGNVAVRGYEGVVRVVTPAGETRVSAGESWPTITAAPLLDAGALAEVAFAPPSPPAVTPPPSVVAAPASSPTSSPTSTPTPSQPEPGRDAKATPRPHASPYAVAKRLEEAGDLDRALAAYQAISAGPEAEDALYAVGRLQYGVLHDPAAARATFTRYRAQHPRGRYARAVDLHLLELALARRDYETVESEATRFLVAHPGDALSARFRLARASARVQRGDCAGAIADLDQLPTTPASTRLRAGCGP
nr:FecR domain-containing protein [Deltaproteobacteria bacterium]